MKRAAVNLIPPRISSTFVPGTPLVIFTGTWSTDTERVYTLLHNSMPVRNYEKVSLSQIQSYQLRSQDIGVISLQEYALIGGVGQLASSSIQFSPRVTASVFSWLDPTTVTGSVSSWVDSINSANSASQDVAARRPFAGLTEMDGYPGVRTFPLGISSSLQSSQFGVLFNGKTQFTFIGALKDFFNGTTAELIFELGTNFTTTNNTFAVYANDTGGGANSIHGGVRGNGAGTTITRFADNLDTRRIVSIGYDMTQTGAASISFIRINGTSVAVSNTTSAAVAGSLANLTAFLFGRGTNGTLPFSGVVGDLILKDGSTQDDLCDMLERWSGNRIGLTW